MLKYYNNLDIKETLINKKTFAYYLGIKWWLLGTNLLLAFFLFFTKQGISQHANWLLIISFVLTVLLFFERKKALEITYWQLCYWYLPFWFTNFFVMYYLVFVFHFTLVWQLINILVMIFTLVLLGYEITAVFMLLAAIINGAIFARSDQAIYQFEYFMLISSIVFLGAAFLTHKIKQYYVACGRVSLNQEKLSTVNNIAFAVAHELRTPLSSISLGVHNLSECVPKLLSSYKFTTETAVEASCKRKIFQELPLTLKNIENELCAAFIFIDMLLMKADQTKFADVEIEICSIISCFQEALERYPLNSAGKKYIHFNATNNFLFYGNKLLMIHIFFNLIKNSLQHIKSPMDFRINISLESYPDCNIVRFSDNGKGISKKLLPHIFKRFYSNTKHGTGIGLTFCKLVMESFGGTIACNSEENVYTEFVLKFPLPSDYLSNKLVWQSLINKNLSLLSSYPSI